MYVGPNDKVLREEAMRKMQRGDMLHSSGLAMSDNLTANGTSQTYQQRQEMLRQYVGKYDKSQLGAVRNPALRARPAQSGVSNRFDAKIRRHR